MDAVLARRLPELHLRLARLSLHAAAPLARLMAGSPLTTLTLSCVWEGPGARQLFDADGAALMANALRASTTLTTLVLRNMGVCSDVHVATVVLGALVGHPSLRRLTLNDQYNTNARAASAALAALVAADAPALESFSINDNGLGDAAFAPLVDALPRNRHLRWLFMSGNNLSERFMRERLLPAVRANAGLRVLWCGGDGAAAEAEELVRRRGQAA